MKNVISKLFLIISLTAQIPCTIWGMQFLGEAHETHGQSALQALNKTDKDKKEILDAKLKLEEPAKIAAAKKALIAKATAAALPKKNNAAARTPLVQLLYKIFKAQNKFNSDLPDEIWESIILSAGLNLHKNITIPCVPSFKVPLRAPCGPYVAYCSGNNRIAVGSNNQKTQIMDVNTKEFLIEFQRQQNLTLSNGISWSPDGQRIATPHVFINTVEIFNAKTGQCIHTLEGHTSNVDKVAWSFDSKHLATASKTSNSSPTQTDTSIRVWDSETGTCRNILTGHKRGINSIAWSHNGKSLATGSLDGTIRLWDLTTGNTTQTFEGHTNWHGNSISWTSDDKYIIAGSINSIACKWDAESGAVVYSLQRNSQQQQPVNITTLSPDGTLIITAALYNSEACIWDAKKGTFLHPLCRHGQGIASIAWSPDNKLAATASSDGTACIWDVQTGRFVHILQGHDRGIGLIIWSADGKSIITLSGDNTIRIWDATKLNTSESQYQDFINGQLTQEQFMFLWLLNAYKIESFTWKVSAALGGHYICTRAPTSLLEITKKINNPIITPKTFLSVLASLDSKVAGAIIDHYNITDAHEKLKKFKESMQIKK